MEYQPMTLRAFSYGGGVQSTAALVLAARREIDFPLFVFANVGNDSEHPQTITYVQNVALPYAAQHGVELVTVQSTRFGTPITLYEHITHEGLHSIAIPLRGQNGAPGRRSCTKHFKVLPIARELKRRGATPADPALMGLGISIDEFQRMRTASPIAWQRLAYPLIDLRLTRQDCERIITDAGLAIPPKSACWFCPFYSPARWREMQRTTPDIFMNAVVLEQDLIAKRRQHGHEPAYLTRFGKPLADVFGGTQLDMFDDPDDTCESGYCMT
jgi:hypothetical protein